MQSNHAGKSAVTEHQGEKKLAEKKTWQIRYRGPLGRAFEKFCLHRLAETDFHLLLSPYREKRGHLCGDQVMLWGMLVDCALRLLPYLEGAEALEEKIRRSVSEMISLQEEDGCISAFPRPLQLQGLDLPGRRYVLNALLRAAAMPGLYVELRASLEGSRSLAAVVDPNLRGGEMENGGEAIGLGADHAGGKAGLLVFVLDKPNHLVGLAIQAHEVVGDVFQVIAVASAVVVGNNDLARMDGERAANRPRDGFLCFSE